MAVNPPGMVEKIACPGCPRQVPYEPSQWFHHIHFLYGLQRGGYPFGKNDLTLEEWQDIGVLRDEYEALRAGVSLGGP